MDTEENSKLLPLYARLFCHQTCFISVYRQCYDVLTCDWPHARFTFNETALTQFMSLPLTRWRYQNPIESFRTSASQILASDDQVSVREKSWLSIVIRDTPDPTQFVIAVHWVEWQQYLTDMMPIVIARLCTVYPCSMVLFVLLWLSRYISEPIQAYHSTHWGRDKMAAIFQTTLSNAFSWMKMLEFRLKFHWNLFIRVQLTTFQHWFR